MQVIKVPGINGLGHTIETRNAGNAIIAETGKGNLMDIEESHVDNSNLDEQEQLIYKNSLDALKDKNKVVFLGGDHSISYSIGKAFKESHGNESFLIIFDAHPDLMPPMENPTHEEWLRGLIEKTGWKKENIILVGLRKIEQEELLFL